MPADAAGGRNSTCSEKSHSARFLLTTQPPRRTQDAINIQELHSECKKVNIERNGKVELRIKSKLV